MIAQAFSFAAKSTKSPANDVAVTLGMSFTTLANMRLRSANVKKGFLLLLSGRATITRSKSRVARLITSKWPLVSGSKLPG